MKFDILKDLVSQRSYFKSRPYPAILEGVGGETGWEMLEWRDQDETWWEK